MGKKKRLSIFVIPFKHDEDGATKFKICQFAVRGIFPKYAKGLEGLRAANKVMDALEEISVPAVNPKDSNDEDYRELLSGDQALELEGNLLSKLKAMVADDGIGWPPSLGREAEMTIDWLNSPFEEKKEDEESEPDRDE